MTAARDSGPVDRVVALIRFLAESDGIISVTAVSRALSLPPSTTHRLLDQLRSQDFVSYDKTTRRYGTGPELLRLSRIVVANSPLSTIVDPILEEMTQATGEASIFALLMERQLRATLASVNDTPKGVRHRIELNQPHPLVQGSTGLAILAYLPDETIDACANEAFSEADDAAARTKTLREQLAAVRRDGFAITYGERMSGAVGISVPVFGVNNKVFGSLCVTLPEQRFSQTSKDAFVAVLGRSGARLSKALGANGDHLQSQIPLFAEAKASI